MAQQPARRGPQRTEDLDPVLQRMLQVTEWKNLTELLREMGVSPNAKRRIERGQQEIPRVWIRFVAAKTGAREDWLDTGQGPIYQEIRPVQSYGRGADIALQRYATLQPRQRQLWLWFVDLIPEFEAELYQAATAWQERLDARRGRRDMAASPEAVPEDFPDTDDGGDCRAS